jgi:hypothetical protein
MREYGLQNQNFENGRGIKLLPILAIFLIVTVVGFLFFIGTSEELNPVKQYFLIPWTFLTGAIIGAPCLYLWYCGKFRLYNPLIFAACSYFIPAFFLGGLILSNGWSEPFFLSLIQDPQKDLPFTMIVVMLGFGGLTVGYFLPFGKIAGEKLGNVLPKWEWKDEHLFTAGFILLTIGFINTVIGYVSGVLGYQKLEEAGIFDGILFLMTLIWLEASFLLWLVLFRRDKLDYKAALTASVLISTAFAKALYAGNRGGLLTIFIMVMLAFLMSRSKITLKQGAIGASILVLCLLVGMIYGTTFRNIKESESQIGMEQYTEHIFATFDAVSTGDNLKTLEQGFSGLAERIDAVSSLAVVVSNYEQLAPYEESYGLDNNIWKDTVTFFIPRVIWNDKPLASEPRKYSELYFNFGENSFTITPMGDLLRNFGIPGVFIGMMILGIFLRGLYSTLIEDREFSFWKITLYFMILTAISYESFYGSIIPYISKVAVISVIGCLIVNFVIKKQQKNK